MYIEVTVREAAHILARGGLVFDGHDSWACGLQLRRLRGVKARHLRQLERKLKSPWYVDGWYIYKRA